MVESFETYRPYLFSIAYRMLGSAMDAEDMVQETYLRYRTSQPQTIISLRAYLTTILTRLCMDQLHLARRSRETYLGPWLPEPISDTSAFEATNPAERISAEESVSLAFLVLMEELQPVERAVFLLREVFDYDYTYIAVFLGKSETACRQALSRAKKRLADHRPRYPVSPDTHRQMLGGFLQAVRSGDMAALMNMLSEDVTLWADGGGKVKGAATRPVVGRRAVSRFSLHATRQFLPERYCVEMEEVNREPCIVIRSDDRVYLVLAIEVSDGHISAVRIIANPDKLTHV